MSDTLYKWSVAAVAIFFTIFFVTTIIPPLLQHPDIPGAFSAGFVNPYAAGYSTDVICCWVIMVFWIVYESPKIKKGWICILLGLVPGVAVGFALYLLMRHNQLKESK